MGGACTRHPEVLEDINDNLTRKLINNQDIGNPTVKDPNLELKESTVKKSERSSTQLQSSVYNEYKRGECVGSGRLGSVYSGLSMDTGEIVAIKTIKINEMNQVIDVVKAVEKLCQLNHKNVIKYYGTQTGENEEEVDIIFEFCNGGSIKQLLDKFDFFDEKLIKLYVRQILEGLVYLHEEGIVHRNINNSNILVDGEGVVKLSDFIVSNILIGNDSKAILFFNTNNGQDPPYWMAPEIILGKENLTSLVDIWSLGCIIIEMATKNPPWSNISTNCKEVVNLIATSNAPPKFPSHVSKSLKEFLNCCLQKSPDMRASARKLLQHEFFKTNLIKTVEQIRKESDSKLLSELTVQNANATTTHNHTDERMTNTNMGSHFTLDNNRSSKYTPNFKHIHIQEKEKESESKSQEEIVKENAINILTKNEPGQADLFSVSMTIDMGESIIPQIFEKLKENANKLIEDSQILLPLKETFNKYNQTLTEESKQNIISSSIPFPNYDSLNLEKEIQNLLQNYDIKDSKLENLSSMEIKKEDIYKLEKFFKELNNQSHQASIAPIEKDAIEHFLKNFI